MDTRPRLQDFPVEVLRERFGEAGVRPFHADQVAAWLYARGVEDPAAMTDLPLDLRERLGREWRLRALELGGVARSSDGTVKARLRADDGAVLESVAIPEGDRTTLCVSTQVGCPLACSFCATGAMGFTRNLRTGEIVDQLCRMQAVLGAERRVTNVVFMGMGEPLLNLPAVVDAIRILQHPKAFALGPRKITVSTAGLVPQIGPLLAQVRVNLAVSLHAATDAVRDRLVPLNRRFPLGVLLDALRALPGIDRRRPVFFEYTLMEGVNDSVEDARALAALLRGLPSKVNLIPMNPHDDAVERPSPPAVAERFMAELARHDVTVTLRRDRGRDIDAACGQLALRGTVPASAGAAGARSEPQASEVHQDVPEPATRCSTQ